MRGSRELRLAVVGGGSTYTPELVDGLTRLRQALPVCELTLIDPDPKRLDLVGGLARRMFARAGHPGRIRTTAALREVAGADAVLLQLRVGGQAARRVDETLPLRCGCVGQETTGAGGLAKALRTVPVVLEIAEQIATLAPDAWIVDFTNPVGIVTRTLLDAGHRALGLCNSAIGFQRRFAAMLGVSPGRVRLAHVGLNHLTWERAVYLDGRDVLPELIAEHAEEFAAQTGLPAWMIRRLGVIPSSYLRYYYAHDDVVARQRQEPSRAERVAAIEAELLETYADPALADKPELLERRGGAYYSEAAVDLIASLLGDRAAEAEREHVVNVRNAGTLPFLSAETVIEVPARVSARGAEPLPVEPVEPLYAGLIAHVAAYEELAIVAALRGGHERVAEALLAHPLIGQAELADRLAAELITANAAHLTWA